MRGFVPSGGITGHDHFFDAFAKFGGTDPRHTGEWVDEVAARAASQNIQYFELMVTPTWRRLNTITKDMTWREDLKSLKNELMAETFLKGSEKAEEQWELEKRFQVFESGF
jgi:adenosine deaminase